MNKTLEKIIICAILGAAYIWCGAKCAVALTWAKIKGYKVEKTTKTERSFGAPWYIIHVK